MTKDHTENMSDQTSQIAHLAAQVEALKTVIVMIDSTLYASGLDYKHLLNEAFNQAVAVIETRKQTPAHNRALLVVKEMQKYMGAPLPDPR
jgi:hypothetical protein